MTLHTLNKTDQALWQICVASLSAGDALVLIEEAVYAVLLAVPPAALPSGVSYHVLREDLALRGISDKIRADFFEISYHEFVALTVQHSRVVNWH